MFGRMSERQLLEERDRAMSLPRRDVTWEQFMEAAKAAGMDRPEFHGRIAKGLGSHVVVGNEKLRIVETLPSNPAATASDRCAAGEEEVEERWDGGPL